MCTVTFIPTRNKVFITSNRDENPARPAALPPAYYPYQKNMLVYPADAKCHGTWIAVKENGDVNGPNDDSHHYLDSRRRHRP